MKNTYKSLLAMTTATTALLGLAGCAGSTVPVASSPATMSQGSGTTPNSSSTSSGDSSAASTPAAALSAWLGDIVDGHYQEACTRMAVSANGTASGTPVPGTPALCAKTAQTGSITTSPETIIKDLHPSFTPKSMSGQASVKVDPVSATGSSVTIDAKQVSIDGTPLVQVIVSNSTGVTAAELKVNFTLTRLNQTWYVSNFNLNV